MPHPASSTPPQATRTPRPCRIEICKVGGHPSLYVRDDRGHGVITVYAEGGAIRSAHITAWLPGCLKSDNTSVSAGGFMAALIAQDILGAIDFSQKRVELAEAA